MAVTKSMKPLLFLFKDIIAGHVVWINTLGWLCPRYFLTCTIGQRAQKRAFTRAAVRAYEKCFMSGQYTTTILLR